MMLKKITDAISRFTATPFGHALEHAVTAAAATAAGLLVTAYFANGHTLHASDLGVAWASFASAVLFFLRTTYSNSTKA